MGFGIGDRILFNIHQKHCIYVAVFQCAFTKHFLKIVMFYVFKQLTCMIH